MTGNGSSKVAKSVARLQPAITYQMDKESRHRPGIVLSQNFATGMQTRVRRKEIVTAQALRNRMP